MKNLRTRSALLGALIATVSLCGLMVLACGGLTLLPTFRSASAAASGPGQAVLDLYAAVQQGDAAAIRALTTTRAYTELADPRGHLRLFHDGGGQPRIHSTQQVSADVARVMFFLDFPGYSLGIPVRVWRIGEQWVVDEE